MEVINVAPHKVTFAAPQQQHLFRLGRIELHHHALAAPPLDVCREVFRVGAIEEGGE